METKRKIQNLGKRLIEELKKTLIKNKLNEVDKIQNINFWTKEYDTNGISQFDVFGLGINSIILLSLRSMEKKRKQIKLAKNQEIDELIPKNFIEEEIIKEVSI